MFSTIDYGIEKPYVNFDNILASTGGCVRGIPVGSLIWLVRTNHIIYLVYHLSHCLFVSIMYLIIYM